MHEAYAQIGMEEYGFATFLAILPKLPILNSHWY
jgi:hypothetical protein